jgi:hypothetical protein
MAWPVASRRWSNLELDFIEGLIATLHTGLERSHGPQDIKRPRWQKRRLTGDSRGGTTTAAGGEAQGVLQAVLHDRGEVRNPLLH